MNKYNRLEEENGDNSAGPPIEFQQARSGPPPEYSVPPTYAQSTYAQPTFEQPPYAQPYVPPVNQNVVNVVQVQPTQQMGAQHTIIIQQAAEYSMTGHIIFSCFVFWCCNWLCGAIAFCVAMSGQGKPAAEAKSLGRCSLVLNVVGIVISFIIIGIVMGLYYSGTFVEYYGY